MAVAETWLPVVGLEGEYEVSDHGRVRSLDRYIPVRRRHRGAPTIHEEQRRVAGRVLKPHGQRSGKRAPGHPLVTVGQCTRSVHALVLEAFVGPCPPGHEALHADDNPLNNWLSNLRWGTHSDNLHDAVRNGRLRVGEGHHHAKLSGTDVRQIRRNTSISAVALAERYAVSPGTISDIRCGRTWKHVGAA